MKYRIQLRLRKLTALITISFKGKVIAQKEYKLF
jgi:hypothetical protein